MKFHLLYTTLLLFAILNYIFCEDWTHSSGDSKESEESRERQEAKNYQISGISLPWVKTSQQHLSTIPKSLLVQVNKDMDNDRLIGTSYFCRVKVVKKIKIIGKVSKEITANANFPKAHFLKNRVILKSTYCHCFQSTHKQLDYNKQQCIIPGKFPLSLKEQIKTVKSENGLRNVPTSGEWPIFEVLVNPRQLNLNPNFVYLRRGKEGQNNVGLLPARPIRAQSAPSLSLSTHRNSHPPPFYLAFCEYHKTFSKHRDYYPGVVQEMTENGTLAFYYGLYSVYNHTVCSVNVVAVLNSRMPPLLIDYRRHFNKL